MVAFFFLALCLLNFELASLFQNLLHMVFSNISENAAFVIDWISFAKLQVKRIAEIKETAAA